MTVDPVFVIGLDAMQSMLAAELIADGRLPNLAAFLESSAWCDIDNDPSVVVGSAWPTLASGCGPGRHGFHSDLQIEPGTYEARRRTPRDITVPRVWDTVSDAGRRCAVLDVPVCTASERINGIHLVEWVAHSHFVGLSSAPADFAAEVVAEFGEPVVVPKCDAYERDRSPVLHDALRQSIDMRERLATNVLDREAWDLVWIVYGESHCAGHRLWHDPDAVVDIYERIDASFGRLVNRLPSPASIMVLFSHGIGPHHAGDHLISEILRRLDVADDGPHRWRTWREQAIRRAQRRGRDQRRAKPLMSERRYFRIPNNEFSSAIRVNVKGREPRGVVAPGSEYAAVLAGLREDLLALEHPDTGVAIVEEVRFTDDLYDGPMRTYLPDAFVIWNSVGPIDGATSPKIGTVRGVAHSTRSGDHRAPGVLAFRREGVAAGRFAEAIHPEDVAPTIAALLGVEMTGVDGAPIAALVATAGAAPASP